MDNNNKPATILTIDDVPANLEMLEKILRRHHYTVRKMPSGTLGIASARTQPPDLILLDIKMPDINGYQVCEALKADPLTHDVPVIFISALNDIDDKVRGFVCGGVDYITKPFQADEVLARVATHIRLYQLQRDMAQAKAQAEAANRAKSAFLANMNHELRTPLNAVLGFAQILSMDETLSSQQQRHVNNIKRSGDYLLTLINDVLDLAKIEAGRFELFPSAWDTQMFFQNVNDVFKMRAEQKHLGYIYNKSETLPSTLYCDERRLRQILMNLLSNAVKFTQQGHITLHSDFHNGSLSISVEDTGIGIAADALEEIFAPFSQVGDMHYRYQGTGLGLAITQRLVNNMGGILRVNSELNHGSRFDIHLPVEVIYTPSDARATDTNTPRVVGYHHQTNPKQRLRILIVEPIRDNREVLSQLLESLGFIVETAVGAQQSLTYLQTQPIDAIIMDLHLPRLEEGLTCIQDICALPTGSQIPIIAVSASLTDEVKASVQQAGCQVTMLKPIKLNALLDNLAAQLPITLHHADAAIATNEANNPLKVEQQAYLQKLVNSGDVHAIQLYLQTQVAQQPESSSLSLLLDYANGFNLKAIKEYLAEQ